MAFVLIARNVNDKEFDDLWQGGSLKRGYSGDDGQWHRIYKAATMCMYFQLKTL